MAVDKTSFFWGLNVNCDNDSDFSHSPSFFTVEALVFICLFIIIIILNAFVEFLFFLFWPRSSWGIGFLVHPDTLFSFLLNHIGLILS